MASEITVPNYSVRARFDNHFFPHRKELHEVAWADSMEDALAEMDAVKRHGGYDRAEIVRADVLFVDGLSRGAIRTKVVKRWRRNGEEVVDGAS